MAVQEKIPVVGLIGGVGSGKSSVSRHLGKKIQVAIVDGDKLGHEVLHDTNVKQELRSIFGDSIFDDHGKIVRASLGRLVFGNGDEYRDARNRLEQIVHPPNSKENY